MSDWAIGDLAVCVAGYRCGCGRCNGEPLKIEKGRIYRVIGVFEWLGRIGLSLDGVSDASDVHTDGYDASRFRKIRPDAHEACEEEFVTLLKKPRVVA